MQAYLQHGEAGSPMRTEVVEYLHAPMSRHANPRLTWTASGYGERIPTEHMVKVSNRWRRVYCYQISNIGTLFIGRNLRAGTVVDLYE